MKGGASPLKTVLLSTAPTTKETRTPIMYMAKTTSALCLAKKTPANRAYMGSLAPQDMKGISRAVSFLSLSFSRALVARMAGTLQPNPITMGMKDLP